MLKNIQAELIKLRYPPLLWLIGGTVLSIVTIIFFAHYNDVESISAIGKNPWIRIWKATAGIFSIFMTVPFIVLLISASIFIENHNSTWKTLYATPNTRSQIILSKILAVLLVIFFTYSLLILLTFFSAFVLNFFMPEIEIAYYNVQPEVFVKIIFITFLNSLGFIGIQFFLSLTFRNFLVPAALGIVAFIIALIVGITNTPISQYFPYAYTLIGQDFEMFTIDRIGIIELGIINSVQLCSIATFVFFVSISLFSERRKSV